VDVAVTVLDSLQPIVNTKPKGSGKATTAGDTAEDGVDADRLELHEAALALSEEKGIAYMDAVHKLSEEASV
jgi:hypothetical protein